MPDTAIRVVDVYPYRIGERGGAAEFLLFRRASHAVYAGEWRMVGGKIKSGEAAWEAAFREVEEETRSAPAELWSLPSVNAFYEWQDDRINFIPAFAARLEDDPVLDDEHDAFVWLEVEDAVERLRWPEQRRLLRLADRMLDEGIPPELVIQ